MVAALLELHHHVEEGDVAGALDALVQLLHVSLQDPLVVLLLQRRHRQPQHALLQTKGTKSVVQGCGFITPNSW